jgi:hypothetical protein
LDDNPAKVAKTGANIPPAVDENLIGEEIPGIDPGATCHRINIDPNVKYLAQ